MEKDGGPAFPVKHWIYPEGTTDRIECVHQGMTLRDYLAAHAIEGCVERLYSDDLLEQLGMEGACEAIAIGGYRIADAMLRVRALEKLPEPPQQ
jgi:hypothetical protein